MDKFRDEIKSKIILLPEEGKILFGVLTADVLYPNYILFEKSFNWGNHKVLQDAISFIFQYIIDPKSFAINEIKDILSSVELITPNTEEFPGILTSFGLDACTSIISTLEFIINKNDEDIVDVAIYARDTVDMFIQEKDNMNSFVSSIDLLIERDDFMLKEKKRQKELIERLANIDLTAINNHLIKELRNKQPIINLSLL